MCHFAFFVHVQIAMVDVEVFYLLMCTSKTDRYATIEIDRWKETEEDESGWEKKKKEKKSASFNVNNCQNE